MYKHGFSTGRVHLSQNAGAYSSILPTDIKDFPKTSMVVMFQNCQAFPMCCPGFTLIQQSRKDNSTVDKKLGLGPDVMIEDTISETVKGSIARLYPMLNTIIYIYFLERWLCRWGNCLVFLKDGLLIVICRGAAG